MTDITVNRIDANPEKVSLMLSTPVVSRPVVQTITREQQVKVVANAQAQLDKQAAILAEIDALLASPDVKAQIDAKKAETPKAGIGNIQPNQVKG